MKKVFIALLASILAATTLVSFKSDSGVTDLSLDGKVGNYPVVMEIQVWGSGPNIIGGYYYYKSQGSNNRISISDDQNLQKGDGIYPVLEESVNGKVTGTFHASHWDMKTMKGTWISANGKTQLPFTLTVINSKHHYIE